MSKLCDFLEAELENRQSAGGDETDYVNEAREALAELAALRAERDTLARKRDELRALLVRAGEALAMDYRTLAAAFNRIHGLPRKSDEELAVRIGKARASLEPLIAVITRATQTDTTDAETGI